MKVNRLSESFQLNKVGPLILDESILMEAPSRAELKAQKKQDKRNDKLRSKAGKVLAKDYDKVSSRATFYIDHNYKKGFTQAEWRAWVDRTQREIDKLPDDSEEEIRNETGKKTLAQKKFDAQRNNAIVVGDDGYYIRRGSEYLLHNLEKFIPGENDKVGAGYFIEPYKYSGNKAPRAPRPTSSGGSKPSGTKKVGKITQTNFKKFQQFAKLTGIQLFDADKKEVKIDDAELDKIGTYTIKNQSVEMPAVEWLEAVKKARPF